MYIFYMRTNWTLKYLFMFYDGHKVRSNSKLDSLLEVKVLIVTVQF